MNETVLKTLTDLFRDIHKREAKSKIELLKWADSEGLLSKKEKYKLLKK